MPSKATFQLHHYISVKLLKPIIIEYNNLIWQSEMICYSVAYIINSQLCDCGRVIKIWHKKRWNNWPEFEGNFLSIAAMEIITITAAVVKGVGYLDHVWSRGVREVVSSIPDRGNIVGWVFHPTRWLVRFSLIWTCLSPFLPNSEFI